MNSITQTILVHVYPVNKNADKHCLRFYLATRMAILRNEK